MNANFPTGTVTFLFTDIEGSTKLAQQYPDQWESLRERHHALLQTAMDAYHGHVFQIIGDAFCVAFHRAIDGINAAIDSQRKIQREAWGTTPIKVRMGLHTGEAERCESNYRGYLTMARVQRVMSVAHGNQILISNKCKESIDSLAAEVILRDMQEHRLKGFFDTEHLWQVSTPDVQQDFPPLSSLIPIPNNLPAPVNRFIGREKEILEIKTRLLDGRDNAERLHTLTGMGGVGKTRLSLQVASEVLDRFKNGVWFVELASIYNVALVSKAIAKTLSLNEVPGRSIEETLIDYLREKDLLLVLDNFEQIVEAAPLIKHILFAAPRVIFLITSRISLRMAGEREYAVPLLALPDSTGYHQFQRAADSESIRLFIERAQSIRPDFKLTTENADTLTEICRRLEGLPLAIELAAANVRSLSLRAILSQLNHRIKFLKSGARDLTARQQTLRGTIDWSHELLTPDEQRLFRRFSVFVEATTLEAIENVCNLGDMDTFTLVDSLITKSLLNASEKNGDYRYSMLGIIKEYGTEKLEAAKEMEIIRARHLEFFKTRVETIEPELLKLNQVAVLDDLEAEVGDLRAAIDWTLKNEQTENLLRLTGSLCFFWQRRGHFNEGIENLETSISAPGAETFANEYVKALNRLGNLLAIKGDFNASVTYFERAIRNARQHHNKAELAFGLVWQCHALMRLQKFEAARASANDGLELYETQAQKWGQALAHFFLGRIELESGQSITAEFHFKQSIMDFRESGDLWGQALSSNSLGSLYLQIGLLESAQTECERSLVLREQMKDRWGINSCYLNLGDIARLQGAVSEEVDYYRKSYELGVEMGLKGDVARAANCLGFAGLHNNSVREAEFYFAKSLKIYQETNNNRGIGECLAGYAGIAINKGNFEGATKLLGATSAFLESSGIKMWRVDHADFETHLTILRGQMQEADFQRSWSEGCTMTMEQAIDYVLEEYRD